MINYDLELYTISQLREMVKKMGLKSKRNKQEMIKEISLAFQEYESYKKHKIDRYIKGDKLGSGKEGTVYSVQDVHHTHRKLAMKCFRKGKSSDKLRKEYSLQKLAAKKKVAPYPYNYDTVSKYIVMERFDHKLIDELNTKKKCTQKRQMQLIELLDTLDKVKIYHNDANLNNFMIHNDRLYIIDFGFSKEITEKVTKELNTDKPNSHLAIVAIILKFKEMNLSIGSYKYLLKTLPQVYKTNYKLN
jgi:tRNA A-37 threonylcarbamoyl transferase component Bud32